MSDAIVEQATQAGTEGSAPSQTIDQFITSRNALEHPPKTAKPESVPGTETPAATPESAPGQVQPSASGYPAPSQTPEEPGSEPEGGGKAVKELIGQRRKTHEAEALAAYWRGVAEGKGTASGHPAPDRQPAPAGTTPQGPPAKPNVGDFDRIEIYEAAMLDWSDKMVEYRARQIRQAVVQKTAVDAVQSAFDQRITEAEKVNPKVRDAFNEVGTTLTMHIKQGMPAGIPMAEFIRVSAHGPQVLLYLHEHMEETARLARTNPILAIAELGQIAGKFAAAGNPPGTPPAQPPVQPSKAPPPVKPVVNNGAPVETPLDKMPIDDFMKERNKAQYGK